MSNINLKKFEMIQGLRNSQQIFYQRNLFNKHSGIILRCISCGSMLSINEDTMTLVKEPNPHTGHADVLPILIDTLRVKKPKTLKDIDFDLESYKEYTVTNEKKLFLQYDNKNRENRVLVFMSQFGID